MEIINAYFDDCDDAEEPYTLTGLCLAIGISRPTFLNYSKADDLAPVMEQARLIIQNQLELQLLSGGRAAGPIFALKNHGWSDRQDLNINDPNRVDPEDQVWTVEVVDPEDVQAESDDDDVPVSNSAKVTPFPRKKEAV